MVAQTVSELDKAGVARPKDRQKVLTLASIVEAEAKLRRRPGQDRPGL